MVSGDPEIVCPSARTSAHSPRLAAFTGSSSSPCRATPGSAGSSPSAGSAPYPRKHPRRSSCRLQRTSLPHWRMPGCSKCSMRGSSPHRRYRHGSRPLSGCRACPRRGTSRLSHAQSSEGSWPTSGCGRRRLASRRGPVDPGRGDRTAPGGHPVPQGRLGLRAGDVGWYGRGATARTSAPSSPDRRRRRASRPPRRPATRRGPRSRSRRTAGSRWSWSSTSRDRRTRSRSTIGPSRRSVDR